MFYHRPNGPVASETDFARDGLGYDGDFYSSP